MPFLESDSEQGRVLLHSYETESGCDPNDAYDNHSLSVGDVEVEKQLIILFSMSFNKSIM